MNTGVWRGVKNDEGHMSLLLVLLAAVIASGFSDDFREGVFGEMAMTCVDFPGE
jgi:hypothetical protein